MNDPKDPNALTPSSGHPSPEESLQPQSGVNSPEGPSMTGTNENGLNPDDSSTSSEAPTPQLEGPTDSMPGASEAPAQPAEGVSETPAQQPGELQETVNPSTAAPAGEQGAAEPGVSGEEPAPAATEGAAPQSAAASPESTEIPPLTSVYTPAKKNNTLMLVIAGLAMVALICGTLIFMASSGSGTTTPGAVKYREERNFLVLSPVAMMDSAGSSTSNGTLNPGETVFIEETMNGTNGEVWGMMSNQQWVLLSDPDYMYLIDEALVNYSTTTENQQYTALKDTYVYAIPGAVSKPVSNVNKDDTVIVQELTTMEDSTWGRIGLNQWVLIEKDGTAILERIEEAVSEKEDEDAEDEKDKEDEDDSKDDKDDEKESSEESGTKIGRFETGIYELNYTMVIRRSASLTGEEVKTLPAGTLVRVAWLKKDADGNLWGELDEKNSGYWVCIQADGTTYMTWQDPDEPAVSTPSQPSTTPSTDSNTNTTPPVVDSNSTPSTPDASTPSETPGTETPAPEEGDSNGTPAPDGPVVDDTPGTNTDPTAPAAANEEETQ